MKTFFFNLLPERTSFRLLLLTWLLMASAALFFHEGKREKVDDIAQSFTLEDEQKLFRNWVTEQRQLAEKERGAISLPKFRNLSNPTKNTAKSIILRGFDCPLGKFGKTRVLFDLEVALENPPDASGKKLLERDAKVALNNIFYLERSNSLSISRLKQEAERRLEILSGSPVRSVEFRNFRLEPDMT